MSSVLIELGLYINEVDIHSLISALVDYIKYAVIEFHNVIVYDSGFLLADKNALSLFIKKLRIACYDDICLIACRRLYICINVLDIGSYGIKSFPYAVHLFFKLELIASEMEVCTSCSAGSDYLLKSDIISSDGKCDIINIIACLIENIHLLRKV